MNFISSPSVHVLCAPQFFDHPEYLLPPGGTPSERVIAHAGKGCYDSYGTDGRSIAEHIAGIIQSRHGSVLEHANISVFIAGISRGLSHELVRHRAGCAYSQRSTRYTREDDGSWVLEPGYAELQALSDAKEATIESAALLNRFKHHCDVSIEVYSSSVEDWMERGTHLKGTARRKWARGKARQLLPHALETRLTMTANLRAWRFILEERSTEGAEPEIRRLAMHLMNAIEPFAPLVFEDMLANQQVHEGMPIFIPGVPKV